MLSLAEMSHILGDDSRNFLPESSKDKLPSSVVTDSRQVQAGCLFVCIKGERSDGHDFISAAAAQGALAALVSCDVFAGETPPLPLIYCADSVKGLGKLGATQRDKFKGMLIGITGSAGKTSVKEVLSGVLSALGKTSRNYMNLNSQIGLPVSILNADQNAAYWVMEAGISSPQDMDELGEIMRPDLAVVLNVGAAHLAGLEDKGVAYYKTRLLKHLAPGGRALVSADYPDLVREARQTGAPVSYFSTRKSDADYYAAYLGPAMQGSSGASGRYRVYAKGADNFEVVVPFRGSYGAENVAAISGAALLAGLPVQKLILGLAGSVLPAQRFALQKRGSFIFIDDSYNANPLSTTRMIESASEIATDNGAPLFLVMGEMLELGAEAAKEHKALGRTMAKSAAKVIVWKGGNAQAIEEGLKDASFNGQFRTASSLEDFSAAMKFFEGFISKDNEGKPKGVILFKASRSMRLELWAELFKQEYFSKLGE